MYTNGCSVFDAYVLYFYIYLVTHAKVALLEATTKSNDNKLWNPEWGQLTKYTVYYRVKDYKDIIS